MVSPVSEATDRCVSCGNDLRVKARFCDACGSPVSPYSATSEHKQVTVLFADVLGSMKLAASLDAERLQEIMNELFNRAAAVVQRYQGTVDKFTGDGLMALFGAPAALKDHALAGLHFSAGDPSRHERTCHRGTSPRRRCIADSYRAELRRRDCRRNRLRSWQIHRDRPSRRNGATHGSSSPSLRSLALAFHGTSRRGRHPARFRQERCGQGRRLARVRSAAPRGGVQPDGVGPQRRRDAGPRWPSWIGCEACSTPIAVALVGIVGDPGLGKSRLINEFTAIAASRGADVVIAAMRSPHHHNRVPCCCRACSAQCSRWRGSATPRPVSSPRRSTEDFSRRILQACESCSRP